MPFLISEMNLQLFNEFSACSIDLSTAPERLRNLPFFDVLINNINPQLAKYIESQGYPNVATFVRGSLETVHNMRGPLLVDAIDGHDIDFSLRSVASSSLQMAQRSLCFCLRVCSSYVAKSLYDLFVREIRSLGFSTMPEFVASSSCN